MISTCSVLFFICACGISRVFGTAGFAISLRRNGLKAIEQYGHSTLEEFLSNGIAHKLEGSMGAIDYILYGLEVDRFDDSFSSSLQFTQNDAGIEIEVDNLTLRVKSPYRVEWLFLFNTGTVYVDVYRMKLQAQMKLDSMNGRLIPRMSKCDARIPLLTVRFEGGLVNQIMNLFEDRIGHAIQGILKTKICDFITDAVVSRMQQAFFDAPLALWLFDFYYLNYTLTENPLITDDDLLTKHDGSVFGMRLYQFDISGETLAQSPYSNYHKMAIVYLSNYTVNTLLYSLYENHALDFDFTKDSLPPSLSGYLDTSCKTLFCAGFLFPELAKRYPNSSLEVYMRLLRSPIAHIKEGVINASGVANFTGYVNNESFDYIFSGIVDIYVDIIDFKLENYSLTGDLKFNTVVLRNVESAVKGIDAGTLDIVIGFAVDEFLQPRLASFLRRGIQLPKAGPFRMVDGAVQLHPDVIVLSTNFER